MCLSFVFVSICAGGGQRSQKMISDALELKLHVGAGDPTMVLYKKSSVYS